MNTKQSLTFTISGMACASCQHNIQKAVSKMRGVRNVNVNLVSATMTLDCDEKIIPDMIIDKVTSIGYGATLCNSAHDAVSNRPNA